MEKYKKYPDNADISKEILGENNSLFKMLTFVGKNKQVVDFGCASGYFANLLQKEDCEVVGVEINPEAAEIAKQYCKRVIVADLDYENIENILGNERFDVATFGDVLEHLKDPWSLLSTVRNILKPDGFVVASIPNVAHGAVRLALLEGKFDYEKFGLLDNTHLRFFTRKSIHHLFEATGYCIDSEDFTHLSVFNSSSLTPILDPRKFSAELLEYVTNDKNSEVLQFIIRAYPSSMASKYAFLSKNYDEAKIYIDQLSYNLEQTQAELEQALQVVESVKHSNFWKVWQFWIWLKHLIKLEKV
ncbi:class I SAM-dependent methyltransferase [Sphaerothrix gracilis]|uniref:class I SAM-dependent methyltransferase n=1 Tax=Sphaerothrix gracilis TaxID=3151835 RepID=UPI0031FDB945